VKYGILWNSNFSVHKVLLKHRHTVRMSALVTPRLWRQSWVGSNKDLKWWLSNSPQDALPTAAWGRKGVATWRLVTMYAPLGIWAQLSGTGEEPLLRACVQNWDFGEVVQKRKWVRFQVPSCIQTVWKQKEGKHISVSLAYIWTPESWYK
jgi:hypothetical protein